MARTRNPGIIPHGSEEHAAMLGLTNVGPMTPERKQELEAQLKTAPVVISKKRPITREEYAPTVRGNLGDEIIDGWTRQGR